VKYRYALAFPCKMLQAIEMASNKDQEIPDIWQNYPKTDGSFVTF
jgi:hypothetical protein